MISKSSSISFATFFNREILPLCNKFRRKILLLLYFIIYRRKKKKFPISIQPLEISVLDSFPVVLLRRCIFKRLFPIDLLRILLEFIFYF